MNLMRLYLDAYDWPQTLSDDEILERLVALNADRAEEERNGLIRWLRPEYQAPETLRAQGLAPLQGVIEGLETEAAAPTPVEQQPWPKKFKEQLAAIRDLLRTSGSEWTLEQIVAQFKGATRSKKRFKNA
jgi:5'-deoxynucleotidase YfbR-like HD superfamily hydrolase